MRFCCALHRRGAAAVSTAGLLVAALSIPTSAAASEVSDDGGTDVVAVQVIQPPGVTGATARLWSDGVDVTDEYCGPTPEGDPLLGASMQCVGMPIGSYQLRPTAVADSEVWEVVCVGPAAWQEIGGFTLLGGSDLWRCEVVVSPPGIRVQPIAAEADESPIELIGAEGTQPACVRDDRLGGLVAGPSGTWCATGFGTFTPNVVDQAVGFVYTEWCVPSMAPVAAGLTMFDAAEVSETQPLWSCAGFELGATAVVAVRLTDRVGGDVVASWLSDVSVVLEGSDGSVLSSATGECVGEFFPGSHFVEFVCPAPPGDYVVSVAGVPDDGVEIGEACDSLTVAAEPVEQVYCENVLVDTTVEVPETVAPPPDTVEPPPTIPPMPAPAPDPLDVVLPETGATTGALPPTAAAVFLLGLGLIVLSRRRGSDALG